MLNGQQEMVFPPGKQMCGSNSSVYTSLGCYAQQQQPQQQQQEYNRNAANFDAFNGRNITNLNCRTAWTPYSGTEDQRNQALSSGMQNFSDVPCSGFQSKFVFFFIFLYHKIFCRLKLSDVLNF